MQKTLKILFITLSLIIQHSICFGQEHDNQLPDIEVYNKTYNPRSFKNVVGKTGKPILLVFTNHAKCPPCNDVVKKINRNNKVMNAYEPVYVYNWYRYYNDFADIIQNYSLNFTPSKSTFLLDKNDELLKYYHGNYFDSTQIPLVTILTANGIETFSFLGRRSDKDYNEIFMKELERAKLIYKSGTKLEHIVDDILSDAKKSILFIEINTQSLLDNHINMLGNKEVLNDFSIARFPFDYSHRIKFDKYSFSVNKETKIHQLTTQLKNDGQKPSVVFFDEKNQIIQILKEDIKPEMFKKLLTYLGKDYYKNISWPDYLKQYETLSNRY